MVIINENYEKLISDPKFIEAVKNAIMKELKDGNRTIPEKTSLIPI